MPDYKKIIPHSPTWEKKANLLARAHCPPIYACEEYNAAGDLVQTRYISTHEFMGQTVTERNVVAVTIAKGIDSLSKSVK